MWTSCNQKFNWHCPWWKKINFFFVFFFSISDHWTMTGLWIGCNKKIELTMSAMNFLFNFSFSSYWIKCVKSKWKTTLFHNASKTYCGYVIYEIWRYVYKKCRFFGNQCNIITICIYKKVWSLWYLTWGK
jgi:hypothetical protein